MPRQTPLDKIRNIGIMAHIDAGKTTTTERILYYTGRTYKLGEVHEGTATMDWMEQEQERGITITSAATTAFWTRLNQQYRINIIDTPGHVDFTVEVERSLRVLDGAVTVLDAVGGVEPQTETVWRQADRYGVPRIIFVNKMDRVGADFDMCLKMVRDRLGTKAVPIQLPLGSGELFTGLIDLVREIEIVYDDDTLGKKYVEGPVPESMKEQVAKLRHEMIEACVESDDAILHKYLEDHKLTEEEIRTVIRKAAVAGTIVPVICGAAFKNKGVQALLDAVVDYLPSPVDIPPIKGHLPHHDATHAERPASDDAPFAALAFKIMTDPYVGKLTFFRVYSGVLSAGSYVYNSSKDRKERIGRLLQMHANKREEIEEVRAGDIAAAIGLKDTKTGDTLSDEAHPIILEAMKFPEPVISVAIEPKTKADQDKLSIALQKLSEEDPTFRVHTDAETAQTIISGMGELHLEVLVAHPGDDRLRRLGIAMNAERRIFLGELLQRDGELVLVGLGLGLDSDRDHRLGELHRLEDDRVALVAQRIAGLRVLEPDGRGDVAGAHLFDLLALIGVHLQQPADALLLVLGAVIDVRAGGEHTRIDPEERQLPHVRIGHDLEGERGERLLVRRLTQRVGGVVMRQVALDRRNVHWRRQVVHHGVEQCLHALVLEGRAGEHRDDFARDGRLAEHRADLVLGQLVLFQV